MGGGMGISQGGSVRIVTERTRMAMPETNIGLFPDVGGGYFLSRCPGRIGEFLALTGQAIDGAEAVALGLADGRVPSASLASLWSMLEQTPFESGAAIEHWLTTRFLAPMASSLPRAEIDRQIQRLRPFIEEEVEFAVFQTNGFVVSGRPISLTGCLPQQSMICGIRRD